MSYASISIDYLLIMFGSEYIATLDADKQEITSILPE